MRAAHALAGLALLLGCATAPTAADQDAAIHARVRVQMRQAAAAEPAVTAALVRLAQGAGGELVKLEHRLKTEASAVRKVRLQLHETPSAHPEDVTLQDMLRYTMALPDTPPGNYVRAVHEVLAVLEAEGHEVVTIKNYWPTGDNYSGVNSVLKTQDGLPWELQFHTPESLKVQADTRDEYEELRQEGTPEARKRALFDAMTAAWDEVPLPVGVLEQGNLHEREQLRHRPRP